MFQELVSEDLLMGYALGVVVLGHQGVDVHLLLEVEANPPVQFFTPVL